jgi:hypothetical protein
VWKYVSSDTSRLKVLKTIQERSESETKLTLEPEKYLHYILEYRANFIRLEHKRPVYDKKHFKGNFLQGRRWYPSEDFQNAHRQTFEEFEEFISTFRDVFYFDDAQYVLNLVIEKGDMVVDQGQLVGINTLHAEQLEKRKRESFARAYSANRRHYQEMSDKLEAGRDILGIQTRHTKQCAN